MAIIHLELIFVFGVKQDSNSVFFRVKSQLSQHCLIAHDIPIVMLFQPPSNYVIHVGQFLCSPPPLFRCLLAPVPTILIITALSAIYTWEDK